MTRHPPDQLSSIVYQTMGQATRGLRRAYIRGDEEGGSDDNKEDDDPASDDEDYLD